MSDSGAFKNPLEKKRKTKGQFSEEASDLSSTTPMQSVQILQPGERKFLVSTVFPELLAPWFYYISTREDLRKEATERLKMLQVSQGKKVPSEKDFGELVELFVRHFDAFFPYHQILDFDWEDLYIKADLQENFETNTPEKFLKEVIRETKPRVELLQAKYSAEQTFPKPSLILGEDTHGEQLYSGFFYFQHLVLQIRNGGHLYFSVDKLEQEGEIVAGSARKYLAVSSDSCNVIIKLYTQLLAHFDGSNSPVRKMTFLCPHVFGEERELFLKHCPLFMPNEALLTVHGLAYAVLDFWLSTEKQPQARAEGHEVYLNGLTVEVHDRSTPADLKIKVIVSTRFPGCLHHVFVFHLGEASDKLYEETGAHLWLERNLLSGLGFPRNAEPPLARKLRRQSKQTQLSLVRHLVVLMASRFYFGFLRRKDKEEELEPRVQIRHMGDFRNGVVEKKDIPAIGIEIGKRLQSAWDEGMERQKLGTVGDQDERKEEVTESALALVFNEETIYEDQARRVEVWKAHSPSEHFLQKGSAPDAFRQLLDRVEADLATRPILSNLEEARAQPDPSKPRWYAHTSRWGPTQRKIMTLQPRLQEGSAARSGYFFSGQRTVGACWNEVDGFEELVAILKTTFEQNFDLCHANLYQARDEKGKLPALSRHSDDESDLQEGAPIVCLSLGNCPMRFALFEKPTAQSSGALVAQTVLEPGSVYVMAGTTQKFLEHHVQPPTEKEIRQYEQSGCPRARKVEDKSQRLRLSLTFRKRQI